MKKILISVLIVLMLILIYVAVAKGINLSFAKVYSIKQIKDQSFKLNANLEKANELSNKTYPSEVENLEEVIKSLKISKQDYENKKLYSKEDQTLGTVEIKTYAIHYLWTILGNYRKDRGVKTLTLDLKSTNNENVYDLDFKLQGNYVSITDFLYDIENDDELNFQIKNFKVSSDTGEDEVEEENNKQSISNNTSTNQNIVNKVEKEKNDGTILKATFTVENVGIVLE